MPRRWPTRRSPAGPPAVERRGHQVEQAPLVVEGHDPLRVVDGEPARLFRLAVAARQVSTGRAHEEVVDELVVAGLLGSPNEPVVNCVEVTKEIEVEAGR